MEYGRSALIVAFLAESSTNHTIALSQAVLE